MSDQATNPKQSEKPAWMLASSADDSKAGSGTPAPAPAASAAPAKPAAPAANAAPMTVAERARAAALAAQQARAGGAAPTPAAPAADKPAAPKPAATPVSAPAPAANTAGMSVAERARAAAKAAQTAREGGAPVVSAPAPVTAAAPAPTPVAKPAAPVAASTAGMSVAERARAAAKAAQSGGSPAPVAKPAPAVAAVAPAPAPKPAAPVAAAPKPAAPVGGAAAIAMPARPAPAPAKREEPVYVPPGGVTRREFLNYIWGASMALLLAESAVLTYLFSFPRFRAGDFGGKIAVGVSEFPQLNGNPAPNNVGKFWMVSTEKGVMTHYKICTHLGCIYGWDESAKIFSCPCHGSQFQYDGTYRAGPAPRGLDRFSFEVVDATDKVLVESKDGTAIDLKKYPDAAKILVNTGNKITGIARA